tara:strand:- start:20460 stop:21869 length:1410 start_codon:yes stop_codon:yes gene_type:complete
MSIHESVIHLINKENLIPEGGRVMAALSGGSDSVALTLLLRELSQTENFSLVGVVHLNHQLRSNADADEQFCRDFAKKYGLTIEVKRVDVRRCAQAKHISLEDAGHRERYALFSKVAKLHRVDCVATGHTLDDQSETLLMRLMRGAGTEALSGIRPRSGCVVRPLLHVSRNELRTYVGDNDETFRDDESNKDLRMMRNRVRHQLIPFLEKNFSSSINATLARTSDLARADAEWIEMTVDQIADDAVTFSKNAARVNIEVLNGQPLALSRRSARRAFRYVSDQDIGFEQIDRFLSFAGTAKFEIKTADFPGCRIERQGEELIIRPPLVRKKIEAARKFSYKFGVPGDIEVPEVGIVISAKPVINEDSVKSLVKNYSAIVSADELLGPLIVRNWLSGDSFEPLGLGGRKKLQDFFVDKKIPQVMRHKVPIVTDAEHRIVWIVGHTISEKFRVTNDTKGMLILKVAKLGEEV